MVDRYIDAVCINLIEKGNYLPIRDQNGSMLIQGNLKVLHRYKNGINIIVDLVNGDALSPQEIKGRLEADSSLLLANGGKGDFYLYTVFVFASSPGSEKIDIIKSKQLEEYRGIKDISCLSVNLASCEVIKYFKIPPTAYGLDRTLEEFAASKSYLHESLPEINELVRKKMEGLRIDFKTKAPVATYVILAVNIGVYVLLKLFSFYFKAHNPLEYSIEQHKFGDFYNYLIYTYGAKENSFIMNGEYWRLVTPIFLHGGLIHLLLNSYFLFSIGKLVERIYGSAKFVFVYMIAGITGNIASFVFSPAWSIGASGALMGMLGGLLYYGVENPDQFKRYFGYNVVSTIVINVIFGISTPGIDNYAHLGGLIGGFLACGTVGLGKTANKYFNKLTAGVLTAIAIIGGLFFGLNKW